MSRAIRFDAFGGPEVLQWVETEVGEPGPTDVLLRHTAVGLNFIDVYHRTGLYPVELPSGLGMEAAGVVEAVGDAVKHLSVGDRVAYGGLTPPGAYCEQRIVPARRLVKLPDDLDDETAAAAMLKGMTAEYLVRRTWPLKAGETILVHAAAGGVGLILCQWAHHIGARVIGTVGSDEKAEHAKSHGCDHVLVIGHDPNPEEVVAQVRALTDGVGVDVAYDAVGQATFFASMDSLRPRGMLVSFGQASGKVKPFDIGLLSAKGSLYLTRPTLMTYNARREDLVESANALFEVLGNGAVKIEIGQRVPLAQAARAHADLEARRTHGSTVLTLEES